MDAHLAPSGQHDWHIIWLIPAGIAAAVLLVFLLMFKDQNAPVPEETLSYAEANARLEV